MRDKKTRNIAIGVGSAIALVGGVMLAKRVKAEPLPGLLPDQIAVKILNPPADAENFSLMFTDWDFTVPIHFEGWNGTQRLPITETAIFNIPPGITFPLKVGMLQITKWIKWEDTDALQELYYVQSIRPYLWDWDKFDWGDEPDPSYREIFISEMGAWYYNVLTESFKKM